jgi:hypothetical protein
VAALLLAALGLAAPSINLLAGAIIIAFAGMLSRTDA